MAPRGEAVTTESAPGGHTRRVAALHHAAEDHRSDHDRFVRRPTPDVVMIEGEVEVLRIDALPRERGDRFAARTGFDPRASATAYRWFRITPRRVQAWREANEMTGRELMRDGRWLA